MPVPINVGYERGHLELFFHVPCNHKCVSIDIVNLCTLSDVSVNSQTQTISSNQARKQRKMKKNESIEVEIS